MRSIYYQVTICYPDRKGITVINKNDYDIIIEFDKPPKDLYGTIKEVLIIKGAIRDNMHIISRVKEIDIIGYLKAGDPEEYTTDKEYEKKTLDLTQELFGQD